jgi:nicotinate phosphoribosyltransferase
VRIGIRFAYLEQLRFTDDDLAYLRSLKTFSDEFVTWLRGFAFTGDVDAVPEGTPVFVNEPILEIVAPIAQAQLVETRHEPDSCADGPRLEGCAGCRCRARQESRRLRSAADSRHRCRVEGGARVLHRWHRRDLERASGKLYGIPVAGTMAHSYVQAHGDEREAFRAFAKTFPGTIILVDTYDTLNGVRRVIELVKRAADEIKISGVRLDSGDLGASARETRRMLDDAGLQQIGIFASSGLDEHKIAALLDTVRRLTASESARAWASRTTLRRWISHTSWPTMLAKDARSCRGTSRFFPDASRSSDRSRTEGPLPTSSHGPGNSFTAALCCVR